MSKAKKGKYGNIKTVVEVIKFDLLKESRRYSFLKSKVDEDACNRY